MRKMHNVYIYTLLEIYFVDKEESSCIEEFSNKIFTCLFFFIVTVFAVARIKGAMEKVEQLRPWIQKCTGNWGVIPLSLK